MPRTLLDCHSAGSGSIPNITLEHKGLGHAVSASQPETWTGNAWDGPQYNTDRLPIPGYVAIQALLMYDK